MNPLSLSPDIALVVSHIAHAIGDLWTIHSYLAPLAVGLVPDPVQGDEEARKAASGLFDLQECLAESLACLPVLPWEGDIELVDLIRADIECVLVDRIGPAIAAFTNAEEGPGCSIEQARARFQCAVVDHLLPAIVSLTTTLNRATT
jgi:hypothetical protein